MKAFFRELKHRNKTLCYLGWIFIVCFFGCFLASLTDHTQIMGINAWIKPMKFYISSAIYCWTMGWLLYYLNEPKKIRAFNVMVIIVLVFELGYITFQAARGQKSHFNISSLTNGLIYAAMGVAITILVLWTAYFTVFFFRRSFPNLTNSYVWGIRLGMMTFVIFALSAHIMASSTGHTMGAPDGSPGLPIVNWSSRYGDLRVAHFFGMHALQLLPLFGYYSKHVRLTVVVFFIYFLLVSLTMLTALQGRPFIAI